MAVARILMHSKPVLSLTISRLVVLPKKLKLAYVLPRDVNTSQKSGLLLSRARVEEMGGWNHGKSDDFYRFRKGEISGNALLLIFSA
jgi:hypothetical protein